MYSLIYIIVSTANLFLLVIEFMMFARAILSWFPIDEESRIVAFLHLVTEPVISPVRNLLQRLNLFQDLPIDISFLITFILISILRSILFAY